MVEKKISFEEWESLLGFGLFAVSHVKHPAIEENQVMFSKDEVRFSVDAEKRTIFAPVLIPEKKIPRVINGKEFMLSVDAETIEKIAVHFMENQRTTAVNIEHADQLVDGYVFYQSIITNELIPTVKGWEHLPLGTWYLGAKVTNDEYLEKAKSGELNGWSIHGVFRQEVVEASKNLTNQEIEELVNKIFNQF